MQWSEAGLGCKMYLYLQAVLKKRVSKLPVDACSAFVTRCRKNNSANETFDRGNSTG